MDARVKILGTCMLYQELDILALVVHGLLERIYLPFCLSIFV